MTTNPRHADADVSGVGPDPAVAAHAAGPARATSMDDFGFEPGPKRAGEPVPLGGRGSGFPGKTLLRLVYFNRNRTPNPA